MTAADFEDLGHSLVPIVCVVCMAVALVVVAVWP